MSPYAMQELEMCERADRGANSVSVSPGEWSILRPNKRAENSNIISEPRAVCDQTVLSRDALKDSQISLPPNGPQGKR